MSSDDLQRALSILAGAWVLIGFLIGLRKLGRNNNPDGLAALAIMSAMGPFALFL
jgi:hypothetical protein